MIAVDCGLDLAEAETILTCLGGVDITTADLARTEVALARDGFLELKH